MIVLGIDTALDACSVALLKGNEVVVDKFTPLAKGHAETIAVLVAEALSEAEMRVADIRRVAVVVGPGGFTGARAGLAFAHGLCVGADFGGQQPELVGVDSFRALYESHYSHKHDTPVAVAIDARRSQVYLAAYHRDGHEAIKGCAIDLEDAAAILRNHIKGDLTLIGSGAELIADGAPNWRIIPQSKHINAACVARFSAKMSPPFPPGAPVYLRAPDAKKSAAGLFAALLADPK